MFQPWTETSAVTSNNVDAFVAVVNRLLAKIPYEDFSIEKMLTRKNYLMLLENNYAAPFADALCVGIAIHEEKRQITAFVSQRNLSAADFAG